VDLKSGYPFWAVKNGLMTAFPPLREDKRCEIAIVGGGITAALTARELAAHGHDVCIVEQRDIGWGSTAASTALLQYEIDVHLVDLTKRHGEDNATLAYRACASAIDQLNDVARAVRDVGFARCDSLYYASRPWHVRRLRAEGEARRRIGLDSRFLEREEIDDRYGIEAPAALLTARLPHLPATRKARRRRA
jgi:glycine/D-amino acid oxidase-like deaminating enzyme